MDRGFFLFLDVSFPCLLDLGSVRAQSAVTRTLYWLPIKSTETALAWAEEEGERGASSFLRCLRAHTRRQTREHKTETTSTMNVKRQYEDFETAEVKIVCWHGQHIFAKVATERASCVVVRGTTDIAIQATLHALFPRFDCLSRIVCPAY